MTGALGALDVKTVALVAAGIGAPTLLSRAARAGVPIPAYVTAGQRAALARLDAAGIVGDEHVTNRYLAYNRARIAAQGAASGHANQANLTAAQLDELCSALLDAAHAGIFADGPPTERYALTDADKTGIVMPGTPDLREAVWSALDDADGRELTDFGRACQRVMTVRAGIQSHFLSSPEDLLSANLACGRLAVEMDDQGYLISGKPEEKTLGGALSAVGNALVSFGVDVGADAGKALLGALWRAVKAEPLFFAGVGFVAWKVLL